MKKTYKRWIALPLAAVLFFAGCAAKENPGTSVVPGDNTQNTGAETVSGNTETPVDTGNTETGTTLVFNEDMFSNRDMRTDYSDYVTVNLADNATAAAEGVTVEGSTVTITKEGTYYFTGTLTDGQIVVNVDEAEKVQIVLDNVNIACEGSAALYVISADKVFVTTVKGTTSTLKSTGEFVSTDDNNINAAVFSKEDLTLNGEGTLVVECETGHAVVSKDDLKVTSGTYELTAAKNGLRGNDSVRIAGGTIIIDAGTDGIHAENEDTSKGYIYIAGGTLDITAQNDAMDASGDLVIDDGDITIETAGGASGTASSGNMFGQGGFGGWGQTSSSSSSSEESTKGLKSDTQITINGGTLTLSCADDAVHSNGSLTVNGGILQITSDDDGVHADYELVVNGGTLNINAHEGLEATVITINDGEITISASDDGINAAQKVNGYTPTFTLNGGTVTISMGQGDTDAVDSNGNIVINGGTLKITAQSAFDYDGKAELNGGTVYVNGTQVTSLTNQFGGMEGMGGPGGQGGFGPGGNGGNGGHGPGGQGGFRP